MIFRNTAEEELTPIIIYNDHLEGLEYIWPLLEKALPAGRTPAAAHFQRI